MKKTKKIIVATGGSGGHINPGLAIANKLRDANYNVEFIGSGGQFTKLIENQGFNFNHIKAFQYSDRGILGKLKSLTFMAIGILKLIIKLNKEKPDYVLGMGGYASIAAILAAKILSIKTAIHEQNVKPGKTNKLLSLFANKMFLSFEETKQYLSNYTLEKKEVVVSGYPVEQKVIDARNNEKRAEDGKFRILVLGGSQGARILSDVVPHALITLPKEIKENIEVVQQARPEDLARVTKIYQENNITHDVASFYTDIPSKTLNANLVIGRSGTGTVCETAYMGRVAIFVPLLLADGHQMENARVLADKNASFILETSRFTPANLAYEILRLIENPEIMATMEKNSLNAITQLDTAAQNVADDINEELEQAK